MMALGLRDYEHLNFYGFDLSFADGDDANLFGISMQGGQLSYASFRRAHILQSDFGGAALENIRMDQSWIERTSFRPFDINNAKGPYAGPDAFGATFLSGASFRGGFLRDVDLGATQAMTVNFDRATLLNVNLGAAFLGGATFRDTVLLDVDFTGADLRSVDFDGAFVLKPDFLDYLSAVSAPESFRPDRFVAEQSALADIMEIDSAFQAISREHIPQIEGDFRVWRLKRIKPFEE